MSTEPTTTTATIEARLARLEATARRWRLLACGAVVAVCAMGAAGGSVDVITVDEVRTKCLFVEDENGNARGVFGFLEKGGENLLTPMGKDGKAGFAAQPGVAKIKVTKSDGSVSFIE